MGPASFWSVHFFSEAGRLAFADRDVYEADPAFYTPPSGLLDPAYLRERSALIKADSSMKSAAAGQSTGTAGGGRRRSRLARGRRSNFRRRHTSRSSTNTATRWR
jgi:gamma-glutamyltranspeptidase